MKIPITARVTIPDGVLVQELQGESVLLNVNTENYYGLDEVGTRIWAVLSEAPSIAAAVDVSQTLPAKTMPQRGIAFRLQ